MQKNAYVRIRNKVANTNITKAYGTSTQAAEKDKNKTLSKKKLQMKRSSYEEYKLDSNLKLKETSLRSVKIKKNNKVDKNAQ